MLEAAPAIPFMVRRKMDTQRTWFDPSRILRKHCKYITAESTRTGGGKVFLFFTDIVPIVLAADSRNGSHAPYLQNFFWDSQTGNRGRSSSF